MKVDSALEEEHHEEVLEEGSAVAVVASVEKHSVDLEAMRRALLALVLATRAALEASGTMLADLAGDHLVKMTRMGRKKPSKSPFTSRWPEQYWDLGDRESVGSAERVVQTSPWARPTTTRSG